MKHTKNILSWIFKLSVFVLMVYFIYYQLDKKGIDFKEAFSKEGIEHSGNYFLLFGAFALGVLNWTLESYKWKTLVNVLIKNFRFFDALKGVLMGVFLGFMTPNRIGEFGGRLFNIPSGSKIKVFSLAFRGGLAQFITTFTIGLICTIFVYREFIQNDYVYIPLFLATAMLILVYYNFNIVVNYISEIPILQRLVKFEYVNIDVKKIRLTKVFAITLFRYLVYVHQYILLAYFFSINVNYFFLFSAVSTMLLVQTLGPSFPLIDLPYRGIILMELLDERVDNELNILFVILLVWILNLVLPAILGYLNFLGIKMEVQNEKLNKHT